MNEKLQYAEMLEIPQSTCNITYKTVKRKKTKQPKNDKVKDILIDKINNENTINKDSSNQEDISVDNELSSSSINSVVKTKKRFKLTAVGVELCVIFCLVLTIIISSAVLPNSGITSFFSNAFKKQDIEVVDNRVYSDFAPCFSNILEQDVTAENGIMTVKNQKSLYAPCDGKIQKVETTENGLYNITIAHSNNFKTTINGAKYCYVNVGDKVFKTIPIAYAGEEISLCFLDGENKIITGNVVETCSSLWG